MKCDVLRVVPIIIDGAKKEPGEVMVNTTLLFPFGREATRSVGDGRRTGIVSIEPFSDGTFQPGGIVATCIVCTHLQLKLLSDWQNPM